MRRAAHHPLADAHQLAPPARVDAEFARAVLAGDLADARVDAQPAERRRDEIGERLEARRIPSRACVTGSAQAKASVSVWNTAARPPARRSIGAKPAARAAATAASKPGLAASTPEKASTSSGR